MRDEGSMVMPQFTNLLAFRELSERERGRGKEVSSRLQKETDGTGCLEFVPEVEAWNGWLSIRPYQTVCAGRTMGISQGRLKMQV